MIAVQDRWSDRFSHTDKRLYAYAVRCALSALIGHASRHGRGWYHFADGEVILAAEVAL